jgi:polygalacturonase
MKSIFIIVFCTIAHSVLSQFNIEEFGAKSDAKIVNTKAIQNAINTCHKVGGGTVIIPNGIFRTGSLQLLSNVFLQIEAGAKLLGSDNLTDFQIDGVSRGIIYAFEAKNIGIVGYGEIDGNADIFFDFTKKHNYIGFDPAVTRQGINHPLLKQERPIDGPVFYKERPDMMVGLYRCEDIVIQNVKFSNSAEWTFRIADSDGVKIDGIKILDNLLIPNSDGIHLTTSRNVRISNCEIHGGDDSMVVTGFGEELAGVDKKLFKPFAERTIGNKTGFAENIVVSNCIFHARSAGIRVGYGDNPIRNCLFQNIVIYDSNRGIGIFNRDKANIENIHFQNINIQTRHHAGNWWGQGDPIHISAIAQNPNIKTGYIKNITFDQITAQSEQGVALFATDESPIEDIKISNLTLKIKKGKYSEEWGGNLDLRPSYPMEKQMFAYDAGGIYIQKIKGLELKNIKITWEGKPASFYKDGIKIVDSKKVILENIETEAANSSGKSIEIINSEVKQL